VKYLGIVPSAFFCVCSASLGFHRYKSTCSSVTFWLQGSTLDQEKGRTLTPNQKVTLDRRDMIIPIPNFSVGILDSL